MENGGRERDQGSESNEDDDDGHHRNPSDPGRDGSRQSANPGCVQVNELSDVHFAGPGWTANFRDSREAAGPQSLAQWDTTTTGSAAQTQGSSWANFTQFQPFSG